MLNNEQTAWHLQVLLEGPVTGHLRQMPVVGPAEVQLGLCILVRPSRIPQDKKDSSWKPDCPNKENFSATERCFAGSCCP